MEYQRDDIYLCPGCGQFYDIDTDKLVEIPYWDMPASFALEVMSIRKKQFNPCHARRRSKFTKVRGQGFGKLGS